MKNGTAAESGEGLNMCFSWRLSSGAYPAAESSLLSLPVGNPPGAVVSYQDRDTGRPWAEVSDPHAPLTVRGYRDSLSCLIEDVDARRVWGLQIRHSDLMATCHTE